MSHREMTRSEWLLALTGKRNSAGGMGPMTSIGFDFPDKAPWLAVVDLSGLQDDRIRQQCAESLRCPEVADKFFANRLLLAEPWHDDSIARQGQLTSRAQELAPDGWQTRSFHTLVVEVAGTYQSGEVNLWQAPSEELFTDVKRLFPICGSEMRQMWARRVNPYALERFLCTNEWSNDDLSIFIHELAGEFFPDVPATSSVNDVLRIIRHNSDIIGIQTEKAFSAMMARTIFEYQADTDADADADADEDDTLLFELCGMQSHISEELCEVPEMPKAFMAGKLAGYDRKRVWKAWKWVQQHYS